ESLHRCRAIQHAFRGGVFEAAESCDCCWHMVAGLAQNGHEPRSGRLADASDEFVSERLKDERSALCIGWRLAPNQSLEATAPAPAITCATGSLMLYSAPDRAVGAVPQLGR